MSVLPRGQLWLDESKKPIELAIPPASYITAVILVALVRNNDRMWHWFVIPVFVCGLLICPDAVRWLRGEYDWFDPKGLVGALGFHHFFLAPLLFIRWDVGMVDVVEPPDWRPWVGYLAILNAVALVIYQKFQSIGFHWPVPNKRTSWIIDAEHALPLFLVFGAVALMAQVYSFFRMGGIAGIVASARLVRVTGQQPDPRGLGLFELAGNSLPMIILMYLTLIRARSRPKQSLVVTVVVLLFILSVTQFLLGGLKGSRGLTVWSAFWMAGIVHYFWRPMSRWSAAMGLVVIVTFGYIYGFYKSGGSAAIERLATGTSFGHLEQQTGRTFSGMLIADFSRVDTQSYQLYRLQSSTDYDLRWGKTYVSAVLQNIPSWIWTARPPEGEKVVAGTDLFYGRGVYSPGDHFRNSSRIYGLAGEAMLNFGIFSAPIPFALWGFLMGRYRRVILGWQQTDARWLLAPLVTLLLMLAPISDLNNHLTILTGRGIFVMLLILLSSRRSAERVSS